MTLLLQILLARLLGVQGFGDYMYVLSWMALLAMCGSLGLDTTAMRYVAEYAASGRGTLVHLFFRYSAAAVTGASLTLSIGLVVLVMLLDDRLSKSLTQTFLASALLLPALSLLLLTSGILRGLKKVTISMLPQWLLRPLFLLGFVGLLALVTDGSLGAQTVMAADAVVTTLLFTYLAVAVVRHRPPLTEGNESQVPLRTWLVTSLPVLAQSLVRVSMNRVDILLIGGLVGTSQAGIYAAASQMAVLLTFGPMAVNYAAAPLFAELRAKNRLDDLQRVVTLGTRGGFGFSLVVGLGLVVVGPHLLSLYGPEFLDAEFALLVLIASNVLGSLAGSAAFLMIMTGNEGLAAWITAAAGLLNLVLNSLMIPAYGILGAALATGASNILWTGALVIAARQRIGVDATAFG